MYGVFFEDINFGADGGLYAELVKNRSFEFAPDHYMGWKMFGNVTLQDDGPSTRTRITCVWDVPDMATCGRAYRTKVSSASA